MDGAKKSHYLTFSFFQEIHRDGGTQWRVSSVPWGRGWESFRSTLQYSEWNAKVRYPWVGFLLYICAVIYALDR